MSDLLKNILSEDEQARLAAKGIAILSDDALELVSGGSESCSSLKKGQSVKEMFSFKISSMMSSKDGIG